MESGVGAGAMLTDHEPGIPGGETPPSTAGGTPAATDARFMERQPAGGGGGCARERQSVATPKKPPVGGAGRLEGMRSEG